MVAAHSRWRAVAETSNLASVVGPRVRFLCLDADETHVVLGANTGSLYVFARRRASADATEDPSSEPLAARRIDADSDDDKEADEEDPEDPERDAEGPLRFLTMVSPTDAPPIEPLIDKPTGPTGPGSGSVTGRSDPSVCASRRNATPALAAAKLHPGGGMCAVANAAGVVQVLAFPFAFELEARGDGETRASPSPRGFAEHQRSVPGRVVAQVPHAHAGKSVTWLEWSADGRRLASGDDRGALCVTDITAPSRPFDGTGTSPSSRVPMTPTELLTTAAVTSVFETKSGAITQASFDANGAVAAVSAADGAFALSVASGIRPRLGAKPRVGPFGACFHARAAQTVNADVERDASRAPDGNASWLIAARPGRRLWVAETWLDEDSAPVTRVAATLRPAVPPPSYAPGAVLSDDQNETKAKPRKFEFGVIRPLGDVCALIVCDRAVALLDVAGGSMLDLFPTGDPGARDVAFGARDVATSGAKAFVLCERPGEAVVWCLEAPASPIQLTRAVADAAAADGGAEAATRALFLATRLRVAEPGLLEDARGRLSALSALLPEPPTVADATTRGFEESPGGEALRELASALEAYEAFVATVPADTVPPPRRKRRNASSVVSGKRTSADTQKSVSAASTVPGNAVVPETPGVARRAAPATSAPAVSAVSAVSAETAPVETYPPAASSTKFFFYNPRSGFVRNGPGVGGLETAAADATVFPKNADAAADARKERRPAGTAARRRAKIVDDIAAAPEFEETAFEETAETFEAEAALFTARLEEDRADALAALAALEAGEAEAPEDAGAGGAPFSRWSAYAPWDLADASEARRDATDTNAAFAKTGLAARTSRADEALDEALGVSPSPADRRRDARRRARRRRFDAAAAAAAALAFARRSLDAGALVPLLRRWRSARDGDDAEARQLEDSREGRLDDSFVSQEMEESAEGVSLALADAAARAVADADAALARAEARLEAAEEELGLLGDDDAAAADPAAAAAAALAARDARFAEAERPSTGSPKSPPASDDEAEAEAETSKTKKKEKGEAATLAMRRALRDVVSAAEEAARARAFAAKAPAREKDGAALARRAEARGAAAREALDAHLAPFPPTGSRDGIDALACLRAAVEGDEALQALASETIVSPGGAALAARVAELALRLSDARVARAARARAAARALAPLEAHLARPPVRALGRFPQLRALLKAERLFARDPARGARSLRALPFVKEIDRAISNDSEKTRNDDANGRNDSRWRLADANAFEATVAPFLEERGDWGARVAFATARCPRCALPLRARESFEIAGDGSNLRVTSPFFAEDSKEDSKEDASAFSDPNDAAGSDAADATRRKKNSLVAFPCGHAFHARCVPEEACVECLRLRGERLPSPAPAAHREGVAVNAALEALFPSF